MSPISFTKDQLEVLQQLINKAYQHFGPMVIDTRSVVQQGDNPLVVHVTQTLPTTWIKDFGTSNHMTGDRT